MPTNRADFLEVEFDLFSFDQLLERLAQVETETPYGYLVTPNVDHLVRLHKRSGDLPQLADIYDRAAYCTCDSRVLARLARWRGVRLPVIPGSDLTAILFDKIIRNGDRIAVVGGDTLLLERLQQRFPGLVFVHHGPPMGLMQNASARTAAAAFIAAERARFTFICVGSPQQELIAAEAASLPGSRGLALCIGAGLEFLTDRQKRAPELVQRFGLEWAHRLLANPRRLWRRYLLEGPRIFALALRWQPKAASE